MVSPLVIEIDSSGSGGLPVAFIVIALVVLSVYLVGSVLTAQYASRKGYPFVLVLLACLFVSFPIMLIAMFLVPPREPPGGSMPAPLWRRY